MPIDFDKLSGGSLADRAIEPDRIFEALPAKAAKYSYLRGVQDQVLQQWFGRRAERDLVIKMNTGSGKTVVGLLTLKSALNEGAGPAVYLTPDNYLRDQVRKEATALGIATEDEPRATAVRSGRAILVTNIAKLFNGQSQFGVVGSHSRIEIGALLVDDAHACLASVQEHFTLTVPSDHHAYDKLLRLFEDELERQSPAQLQDIKSGATRAVQPIPFWAWTDRQDRILAILHPHKDEDQFKFEWPLLQECLPLCRAVVTADVIQIAPPCPPVERLPSFVEAPRRLYLTATLSDDSVLVTDLGANPESVAQPITPRSAADLGDRLILIPQETYPTLTDETLRDFVSQQGRARGMNVVVIVPSGRRAQFWKPVAAATHDKSTIHEGVAALQDHYVGLVVLVNKYDGIDLPQDACRLLVVDGLPESYSPLDRVEFQALGDSEAIGSRQVQRIEQGMGRGVRSNDDYCVVMLLGSRLVERLYGKGIQRLSPATAAQLDLSRRVGDMLGAENPLEELTSAVNYCLSRDPGWITASRNALDGLMHKSQPVSPVAVAERAAFDLACRRRYDDAVARMDEAIATAGSDPKLRGYLKQQAAAYTHFFDQVRAQNLQRSAIEDNHGLLRPRDGVGYRTLRSTAAQAEQASSYMASSFRSGADVLMTVNSILERLMPDPETTNEFEQAVHDLGYLLGFAAQRPERDTGTGPDVLWSVGDSRYFVIECKSGATTPFISKSDASQLSGSIDWFEDHYDKTCRSVPLMVHPSADLHEKASARDGTRVITFDRLARLREAVRSLGTALASTGGTFSNSETVGGQLKALKLTSGDFLQTWTTIPR
jgi:hypothetical protein